MFRDPGTTGPHRLKKRKDRSALVPVLALLVGQRANFPNALGLACRNPATTPGQRTGWIMRREAIPPAAISFSRPGVGSVRLRATRSLAFGLLVLAAGRHWVLPPGRPLLP